MTQEDKKLLLKDLCGRLPYAVKLHHIAQDAPSILESIDMYKGVLYCISEKLGIGEQRFALDFVKPYLRPLSSMTEAELEQYHILQSDIWKPCGTMYYDNIRSIDWLNEHHFDYRRLIEKGLAIEVTEENNPYKE